MVSLLHQAVHGWTLDAGARLAVTTPTRRALGDSPASILDLPLTEAWCTERNIAPAHLSTVYRHLFRRRGELDAAVLHAAGLPKAAAAELCADFSACTSSVVQTVRSAGGLKLVVELASGRRVETVLILHNHISSGSRRATVCVSSQVGCARGCTFCATGTMGALQQLSSAEILEQARYLVITHIMVWHAKTALRLSSEEGVAGVEVRNIVFMGMGEPLDNMSEVLHALRGLTHQAMFDLGAKHITVSTVGATTARIRQLADLAPKVKLALSLHGATQPLRQLLIPSATSMLELNAALDYHARTSGGGLCVEYLLIDEVNDADEHADELAAWCVEREREGGGHAAMVNLIPYNPTSAGDVRGFEPPTEQRVASFHARLRARGLSALVRWTSASGRDVDGACGQLALKTIEPSPPLPPPPPPSPSPLASSRSI